MAIICLNPIHVCKCSVPHKISTGTIMKAQNDPFLPKTAHCTFSSPYDVHDTEKYIYILYVPYPIENKLEPFKLSWVILQV